MSKKFIAYLIILASLSTASCLAQKVSVSIESENVLFVKYPNKVKVVVEGLKCGEFKVHTTNGTLNGEGCDYEVIPEKEGRFQINIYYNDINGILINKSQVFKVVAAPIPVATISNVHSGAISFEDINKERTILCDVFNWDYENRFRIKSFTFSIQRRHRKIYSENVDGDSFTDSIIDRLHELKRNSKIIISNMTATGYNMEVHNVEDIVIEILK